jgi:hypothetical protein
MLTTQEITQALAVERQADLLHDADDHRSRRAVHTHHRHPALHVWTGLRSRRAAVR